VGTVAERYARAAAWRSRITTPSPSPLRPTPPARRPVNQDAPEAPAVRIGTEAPAIVAPPAGLNAEGEHAFYERLGIGDDLGMRLEDALAIAVEEAWLAHHTDERRTNAPDRLHALAAIAADLWPGAQVTRRRGPREAGGIDAGEILDRIAQANAKESMS
jgi:hypothetical protein